MRSLKDERRERVGRLHVLTDETLQDRYTHAELARRAAAGGADVVQYRDKRPRTTRQLVDTARAVRAVLDSVAAAADARAARAGSSGVLLIVDDRADVALAAGADGLHLGRDDLELEVARRILGTERLIGGTANSLAEARARFAEDYDYLGVGPVFGTTSKAHPAPALGLEALAAIAAESPLPVLAIGGITPERVHEVLHAGAHGIAVLSGVACAADPLEATARYREAIESFRGDRAPAGRREM